MLDSSNLLAALRDEDLALLEPYVTACRYRVGEVLCEHGDMAEHCFFPCDDAAASFFILLESGVPIETVMVGREGVLGGIVSHGPIASYARCTVMHSGRFYRMSMRDLEAAKKQSSAIRHLFARYADCIIAQTFQSMACNASHTIEQRASKWLVTAVKRTGQTDVTMTQEQLASIMGIGRSYVSRVIQRLKRDRLIKTRRGGIEVLDRDSLEQRACPCNEMVCDHFRTVMSGIYRN